MQGFGGCGEALYGLDRFTVGHDRQRQAGEDRFAVYVHRASTALPVIASLLRAGKPDVLAQGIEQCCARIHSEAMRLVVHAKREFGFGGCGNGRRH